MHQVCTYRATVALLLLTLGGPRPVGAAPKTPPASSVADNLGVAGQDVTIFQTDPKLPGRFLFKIWARGINGTSQQGTFTATGVSALLFQKGRPTARLTAPVARADKASQTVIATGRVHVYSVTQPGTTLEADTVVWHAKTNQVEASGNVVYRNGKQGTTVRGPRFLANTALQTITSAGPGRVTFR